MTADGTPDWAYDEDGYCVCCGNGKWKEHMPECELADALEFRARVTAALDAPVTNEEAADWGAQCAADLARPILARIEDIVEEARK